MCIRHKRTRIRLNHTDMKALPRILPINHHTRCKRALETSRTIPYNAIHAHRLGIRKRDSRRARRAFCCLVNVRGSRGGGIEFALEIVQGDVVAYHVGGRVHAEDEGSGCAGEAAIDDFFGNGVDVLHGGECEELVGVEGGGCDGGLGAHVEADLYSDDAVAGGAERGSGGAEH